MGIPAPAARAVDPRWFKQAQRGLYAGKERLSGNHVSASKRHTRRHWLPNVQRSHLWSDVFQRQLSLNVTTHALRQIDRVGGLDNYVLGTDNLESVLGQRIKVQMQRKLRATDARERRAEVSAIRTMYVAASPEQKVVIEATLRAAGAGAAGVPPSAAAAEPQMR